MARAKGIKLSAEERSLLTTRIAELRSMGTSIAAISRELEVHRETVTSLWHSYLGAVPDRDKSIQLKERIAWAETLAAQALHKFYQGQVTARDAIAALEYADRVSGLDSYIKSIQPIAELPPILDLAVQMVDIELPEDSEDD
jgi:lambda repressor-like predicted transcriptional regulator